MLLKTIGSILALASCSNALKAYLAQNGLYQIATITNGNSLSFTALSNSCTEDSSCSFTPTKLELYTNPYTPHNLWELNSAACSAAVLGSKITEVNSDLSTTVTLPQAAANLNTLVLKDAGDNIVACGAVLDDDSSYELIQFPAARNDASVKVAAVLARQSDGSNIIAVHVSGGAAGTVDVNTWTHWSCGDNTYVDDTFTLTKGDMWHRISFEASNQQAFNILGLCIQTQLYSESSGGNPRRFAPIQDLIGSATGTDFVFSQKSPFHPTTYNLKYDQSTASPSAVIGGYHVHKFPIGADNNDCSPLSTAGHFNPFSASSPWGPAPRDYEVGDLSSKHGSLENFVNSASGTDFTDFDLPLFGANTIAGRSIVFHATTGARIFCLNLVYSPAMQTVLKTIENDSGYSAEVRIRQNSAKDPRGPTFVTFRSAMLPSTGVSSSGHDVKLVRGTCASLGNDVKVYGDLSFSNDSISTVHETDMMLNFDGEFGDFRIWPNEIAAVITEADNSNNVLLCEQIANSAFSMFASVFLVAFMQLF